MSRPDFFIAGAPKAGTTSLLYYLREHPAVFMPQQSEPFYFADDLNRTTLGEPFGIGTHEQYLALFQPAEPQHAAVGEKSVWYLYSKTAAARIKEFSPQARIIVMLRNPVDLFVSLHAQLTFDLQEDERNAELAWALQQQRSAGQKIPSTCEQPEFLRYREICQLGQQVERLLTVFSREQVKLVLFDDFVRDTQQTYDEILTFLELDCKTPRKFQRVNPATDHRWRWLASALGYSKTIIQRLPAATRPVLNLLAPLKHAVRQFNTVKAERTKLRAEFREELVRVFQEDVERLQEILGRRLEWG